MTNQQHPITPPRELVEKWIREVNHNEPMFAQIAVMGAQWGADQQLAEDVKWLDQHALDAPHLKITPVGESLIEAMRPKPPSLKEQALASFKKQAVRSVPSLLATEDCDAIRRALGQLDEL